MDILADVDRSLCAELFVICPADSERRRVAGREGVSNSRS